MPRHFTKSIRLLASSLLIVSAVLLGVPQVAAAATLAAPLSYGDQNAQVAALQSDLDLLGYPVRIYTGFFGPVTGNRVSAFQRDWGLPVTGKVNAATRDAILEALNQHFHYVTANLGAYPFTVGDTGPGVEQLQRALAAKGYDVGPVNGVLMGKTVSALCRFQADRGLAVTAVVDAATNKALGLTASPDQPPSSSGTHPRIQAGEADIMLLAHLIQAEAGIEPYLGKVAVGAVVINRMLSSQFPNTLSGVIYQKNQFEPVSNGTINRAPSADSIKAARQAVAGSDPTGGALYFFDYRIVTNKYLWARPLAITIGTQRFAF